MWTVNELIVLSDLHLAPNRNTGSVHLDHELAACLKWILKETSDCMVVLAGDVFDFLALTDCSANGFDRFTCFAKQVTEHHPEIFDALAKLAQSPQHTVVFMSGECDAELMIPQVQDVIERRLGSTGPKPSVRWLVFGEALRVQVGPAVVVIEHGNSFDPWNRLDYTSLQTMLSLASRKLPEPRPSEEPRPPEPPLSVELTSKVISKMRVQYPWIDCLKPVNESILPLLWPFTSQSQRRDVIVLADRYETIKTKSALKKFSNLPDPAKLYQGEKEARSSREDQIFEDWIDSIYVQQSGLPVNNNSSLMEKIRAISNQDWLFEIERPSDTLQYLKPMFESGADLIIHGHTRAAKICAVHDGLYINAGAWSPLLQIPKSHESNSVWEAFLERLRTNTAAHMRRPTLAHVHQQRDSSPVGALLEWRSSGPVILATRHLKTRLLTKE